MEFRGRFLHVKLTGHLCEGCWERREEVKRYCACPAGDPSPYRPLARQNIHAPSVAAPATADRLTADVAMSRQPGPVPSRPGGPSPCSLTVQDQLLH